MALGNGEFNLISTVSLSDRFRVRKVIAIGIVFLYLYGIFGIVWALVRFKFWSKTLLIILNFNWPTKTMECVSNWIGARYRWNKELKKYIYLIEKKNIYKKCGKTFTVQVGTNPALGQLYWEV